MAAMNEVMMNHGNRDPKWMAETYRPGNQAENKKHMDPQRMENRKQREAAPTQPKASSKAPEIPQTHFRVPLCCNKCEEKAREEAGEVPGVVSLITNARESRVTVLGAADPAAVLKKLKKHVDKKAIYWPADVPVQKVVGGQNASAGGGERGEKVQGKGGNREVNMDAAGPGMNQHRMVETVRPDQRMVDPRKVEPILAGPRMIDPRMVDPRMIDPRMVDPRMIDPRMVDPRMVDPRMIDPRMVDPRMIDPRMVDPRERRGRDMRRVRFADQVEVRGGDVRAEMRPVDPRQMRGGDVRAEMQPAYPRDMRAAEVREGWLVDPRDPRGGEMRAMRPVDPREMRGGDMRELRPVDPRGMRRPIDAREMHPYEYAPRDMRPVFPRTEMRGDPRDYRYTDYPHYSTRPRDADLHEYQPKDSYFSDYRPSQNYPANYSTAPVSFYEEGVTNPYYRN
ncbi:hypothetical protein BDL97_16G063700 [Sphagnum fallax]|nr:hypothetical protein BDL97_16G063700 [Sphagnum fallax]